MTMIIFWPQEPLNISADVSFSKLAALQITHAHVLWETSQI